MKMHSAVFWSLIWGVSGTVWAATATAAPSNVAPATVNRTAPDAAAQLAGVRAPDDGTKTGQDNSVPAILERFVMGDAFSPDFENGGFDWKGKRFDVGNSRAVRARFERYLLMPLEELESDKAYREVMAKIEDLLQAINAEEGVDKPYQAWTLLYDAAKFPVDAEGSLLVANQVFNAWSVRGEYRDSLIEKAELERTRREQERSVAYWTDAENRRVRDLAEKNLNRELRIQQAARSQQQLDMVEQNMQQNSANKNQGGKKNATGSFTAQIGDAKVAFNGTPGSVNPAGTQSGDDSDNAGSFDYAGLRVLELTRTNAELAAADLSSSAANIRAKLEFQTQILSFLLQRRFQHALIAIAFYQNIFKGSHQGLEVGRAQVAQFLNAADVTPSMRTLESIARSAQADVRSGMQAVNASYEAGDRWAALERLQETFLIGEYHPDVNAFPMEKRRVLLEVYRAARDLQKVGQLKDYAAAQSIVEKISELAPDFPAAPVLSAVRGAQQASNIALYSAKQAMLSGNTEQAQKSMRSAVELWPLNPEIGEFSKLAADRMDLSVQAAPMFDALLKQKNYRQIASQAVEFGLAFHQDQQRSGQLKNIVERISRIDIAIAYAKEALAQKNPYAAWETLLNARAAEPDDPELARTMGDAAAQVGDFARLLSDGETALSEGRYPEALAFFMVGQDLYPASQLCRIGIDNAGKALMCRQADKPVADSLRQLRPPQEDKTLP